MTFPIGVPLKLSLSIQPSSRYPASKPVRTHRQTDTQTHAANNCMFCLRYVYVYVL